MSERPVMATGVGDVTKTIMTPNGPLQQTKPRAIL
jgi:hypothetical protein